MSKDKNQRKISNIVIDPKAQLRLFIPFFSLFIISVGVIMTVLWQLFNFNAIPAFGDLNSTQELIVATKLNQLISNVINISLIGIFLLGSLTILFWILYSHRIFGPSVPIQRQIDKLRAGDYEYRIHLRKYDEFKSLAEGLNDLAENLTGTSSAKLKSNDEGN